MASIYVTIGFNGILWVLYEYFHLRLSLLNLYFCLLPIVINIIILKMIGKMIKKNIFKNFHGWENAFTEIFREHIGKL